MAENYAIRRFFAGPIHYFCDEDVASIPFGVGKLISSFHEAGEWGNVTDVEAGMNAQSMWDQQGPVVSRFDAKTASGKSVSVEIKTFLTEDEKNETEVRVARNRAGALVP